MTADTKPAYDGSDYPHHAERQNTRSYWIVGALITAAAIGGIWYTNQEIHKPAPEAEAAATPPPPKRSSPNAESTASSGMKRAGVENTRTPQVGRASGDDGAPKPASPSENPDDLSNLSGS